MSNILRKRIRAAVTAVRRFARARHGAMAPLVLILFFLMVVMGGIAVDAMRFETRRVAVQNTMDRSTLAAASLTQALAPEAVVNDYFARAGLEQELDGVAVETGMNFRIVRAEATVSSNNFFLSMIDIPKFEAELASQAEQRITNVEIALVLDVSGSMQQTPSRITNLKKAAKEFIDTALRDDDENKISISIVPYNGQVNLGPDLYSLFNVSYPHNYPNSYCLDLPTTTFSKVSLPLNATFPQVPFIDTWTMGGKPSASSIKVPTLSGGLYTGVWCNPLAGNFVRVHSNNANALKAQIDGLVAVGATSIDLGMKWGAFLLDPSAQPIVTSLSNQGKVAGYFEGRPAAFNDPETLKVIVLMTDGENFEMERIGDEYRNGISPVWMSNKTGSNMAARLSIFQPSRVDTRNATTICNSKPFWVPSKGTWQQMPWNGTAPSSKTCFEPYVDGATPPASYKNVSQLEWQDLWSVAHADWVAYNLIARSMDGNLTTNYNNVIRAIRTTTDTDTMDQRLWSVCDAAKDEGILVYGIAFETTNVGKTAIRNCVSEPVSTYFFDVKGLQISTAFALIASNLSQLKLTQ